MQNICYETEISEQIRKRNRPGYADYKYCIIFGLIFVLSFILGAVFCNLFASSHTTVLDNRISGHFSYDIQSTAAYDFQDYVAVIIDASMPDIRHILLIFASGFTYFCIFAAGFIDFCRGFTFGYCITYLLTSDFTNSPIINNSFPLVVLYIISRVLLSAATVYFCAKSMIFCQNFKNLRITVRRRVILRSPIIYRYIFVCVTVFGLVILVNTVYLIFNLIL